MKVATSEQQLREKRKNILSTIELPFSMKEWQLQLEAKSTDQLIQSVIQQQQLIVIERPFTTI